MAKSIPQPFIFRAIGKLLGSRADQKGKKQFVLDKRQKFGIGVALLSIGLFFSKFAFNSYGPIIAVVLGLLTELMLFWAIHEDFSEKPTLQVFLLPFLFSISFGLFSFLTPARIFIRIILTILYGIGLYSVFLTQNIFTVASLRTIGLLHSARIVSLILSLVTFFFLTSISFSLRFGFLVTIGLLLLWTCLLSAHALWMYTLESNMLPALVWIFVITICVVELGVGLWFWPSTPVLIALFLTSTWYILTGLSHVWIEKRLFRNVLWEYVWVAVISFVILIAFTKWR